MTAHSTIIRTDNLRVWYGDISAIKGISLDIPQNQITALIGGSGSGKSTFLRCINRMLDEVPGARVEGQISVNGTGVLGSGTDVVHLRRKVGMVFQNPTPFPKSVFDNVAYGLEIQGVKKKRRRRPWHIFHKPAMNHALLEKSDHPVDGAVVRSLKEASLWEEVKDRLHQSAYRLSGGQQQRLCIARAIAVRPDILLFDEPCSALDPISTRHIEDLLLRLKSQYTIVIVTHNMHQARRIADRVAFMHAGELVEYADKDTIFGPAAKQLTRDYVGGAFG